MYNSAALRDMHARAHSSLSKVLAHCEQFSAEEIDRVLPCFDDGSLRLRLHHIIGCEQYWIGVLQRVVHDEEADGYPDIASLQAYRERIFDYTEEYLRGASDEELNTARMMTTWGDQQHQLVPACVVVRTVTHIYHHIGQVLVMCRAMGRPLEGVDFPLRAEF